MPAFYPNGAILNFASCMFARPLMVAAALASAVQGESSVASQSNDAYVTAAQGQVSINRDDQVWAVSSGERVQIKRVLTTGADGYARLELSGGSDFEIFSNSRVGFRQNAAAAGDLIDVFAGHVKVHMRPGPEDPQQRVFTPDAVISASESATIAIAVDGNDLVRIDVLEGQVRVQHKLLPRSEPTIVKAVDAILVEPDEQISRRVDRGTLYRYAIKPLHDLFSVLTPGHSGKAEPVEQKEFLARR
jgi:ferric-dicitrate binding protein FerR (iron transport regulator)